MLRTCRRRRHLAGIRSGDRHSLLCGRMQMSSSAAGCKNLRVVTMACCIRSTVLAPLHSGLLLAHPGSTAARSVTCASMTHLKRLLRAIFSARLVSISSAPSCLCCLTMSVRLPAASSSANQRSRCPSSPYRCRRCGLRPGLSWSPVPHSAAALWPQTAHAALIMHSGDEGLPRLVTVVQQGKLAFRARKAFRL